MLLAIKFHCTFGADDVVVILEELVHRLVHDGACHHLCHRAHGLGEEVVVGGSGSFLYSLAYLCAHLFLVGVGTWVGYG